MDDAHRLGDAVDEPSNERRARQSAVDGELRTTADAGEEQRLLDELGGLCLRMGQPEKALRYLARAQAMFERVRYEPFNATISFPKSKTPTQPFSLAQSAQLPGLISATPTPSSYATPVGCNPGQTMLKIP